MKNRKHSLTALLAAILFVAAVLSIASASKPVQDDTKAVTKTSYGTVDQSAASLGRITFMASGQERCFILQDPDGQQVVFTTQENEPIEISLTGGTGRYQYAIADLDSNGKDYIIQYKDSFTIS